jgi:hypothetical protein
VCKHITHPSQLNFMLEWGDRCHVHTISMWVHYTPSPLLLTRLTRHFCLYLFLSRHILRDLNFSRTTREKVDRIEWPQASRWEESARWPLPSYRSTLYESIDQYRSIPHPVWGDSVCGVGWVERMTPASLPAWPVSSSRRGVLL